MNIKVGDSIVDMFDFTVIKVNERMRCVYVRDKFNKKGTALPAIFFSDLIWDKDKNVWMTKKWKDYSDRRDS